VFASGFPADVANRRDGDVPFDDGYLCDFLTALHMSHYWLCYRHNNQFQSSSSLGLQSFMLVCVGGREPFTVLRTSAARSREA
jgi:hypothetical protein